MVARVGGSVNPLMLSFRRDLGYLFQMKTLQRLGVYLLLLALILGGPLPFSSTSHAAAFSKEEERKVGKQVSEQVHRTSHVADDPYLLDYLNPIAEKLAKGMDAKQFTFRLHVLADPRVNAFAIPGGYIFITSGAVTAMNDEEELAGVLAHEMGHVEARHIADRMEKNASLSLLTTAALLAGIIIGATIDPSLGMATAALGSAGGYAKMLQYSRADEEDADRRALVAMQAAGYTGWGLVRFMDTLRKLSAMPTDFPEYLLTHPLPDNRAEILSVSLPTDPPAPPDGDDAFLLFQARVIAFDPTPWSVGEVLKRAERLPKNFSAQFGAALVLRTQKHYDQARTHIERCAFLQPGNVEVAHEQALIELRTGNPQEAVARLEAVRTDGKASTAMLRDLGWAYLEQEKGVEALAVYDQLAERDPEWRELPYQRGIALGKAGREGEAHAELGRYYRNKNPELALRHYKQALDKLEPGELRDKIEAALKKAKQEWEERER